jgi:hypothetical protein
MIAQHAFLALFFGALAALWTSIPFYDGALDAPEPEPGFEAWGWIVAEIVVYGFVWLCVIGTMWWRCVWSLLQVRYYWKMWSSRER